jgi:hypothetical protein
MTSPELHETRRRQPDWVVRTIIAVCGLLALLVWFIFAGQPYGASPGPADTQAVGTTGDAAIERVPGTTSGPTAERDERLFPLPDGYAPGQVVAYLDRQPLFIVADQPLIGMPDREMILEERANEEGDQPKYGLYVPASQAAEKTSARFYYLKIGPGRYLKVSLIR